MEQDVTSVAKSKAVEEGAWKDRWDDSRAELKL